MATNIRTQVRGAQTSTISGRADEFQVFADHINRLSSEIERLCDRVENRVNRSGGSRLRAIVREYTTALSRRRLIRSRIHYNTLLTAARVAIRAIRAVASNSRYR